MTTNKNEAQTLLKHISFDCTNKFNSITHNSNEKWKNKTRQCQIKNNRKCEKIFSWNPSICICENNKYLKIVAESSANAYDINKY